jgi:hypothetical protein
VSPDHATASTNRSGEVLKIGPQSGTHAAERRVEMGRNIVRVMALAAVVSLLTATQVKAGSTFELPPELNAPGWLTNHPYQRNILYDFSEDPRGGPTPNGTPDAEYFGALDDVLQDSDECSSTGGAEWYDVVTGLPGGTISGMFGIDNRAGVDPLSGTLVFHLDNRPRPNPVKHIWVEMDAAVSNGATLDLSVVPQPGSVVTEGPLVVDTRVIANDLVRQNIWAQIQPNPFWEELVFEFNVPAGEFALLDQVHVATECIPEPGGFALFGAAGVAGLIRRRRR